MSGGVDSSTAAYILKSSGHEVVGLSMQMYDNLANADSVYGGCCTIAAQAGLSVARKKESYEICFVPQRDGYAKIVEREAGIEAGAEGGDIVDVDNNVVGRHDGYYHFTIGQRRGLQAGGSPSRSYVL